MNLAHFNPARKNEKRVETEAIERNLGISHLSEDHFQPAAIRPGLSNVSPSQHREKILHLELTPSRTRQTLGRSPSRLTGH
mmetsp:Transcript_7178/g.16634  ORF Transcript_7178/g.16634 Transcript_7178/m.16634 type:complete len:81 (+) Transcript_7178:1024-1266(+)